MKEVAIYLAGAIQKEHEKGNELYWSEELLQKLHRLLDPIEVTFLNPAVRSDNLSNHLSVFGRDMTQVFSADLVLVDARDRRGLGVGAEMMWAKVHGIAVVSWAPAESHYSKGEASILGVRVKNYIHPFVESLSDQVVATLEEAAHFIHNRLSDPTFSPKGIEDVTRAMEHYLASNLENDLPMKQIIASCDRVKEKVDSLTTSLRA